ncbi:MAG TPA: hypothetical protein VLT81_17140 [Chondromyces sp.]|nr:hypothetical protein [Chondromyces sp.]
MTTDATRPPARAPGREDLVKALAIAAASFALYLLTRTRHFGGDDTVFATVVQRWLDLGEVERAFLHPHHVLYNPLVGVVAWLVRAVTGSVFVLDAGAAVAAAAAAVAVAGVYLVARRHGVPDDVAVLTSATLAVSGGMWHYATTMEVYTLAAAGVVAWLAAVADDRSSWRRLAAGFAAPWLGHTVLLLLLLPGVWLQRRRARVVVAALAAGVALPGLAVAGLLALARGVRSPVAMAELMVGGGLGHWLSAPDVEGALRALQGTVVWRSYHALAVYPPSAMTLFDLLGGLAAAVLAAAVVWGGVRGLRDRNPLAVAAASGVAVLVPLWLVWDTGNPEHAVAATPLFAVLAAIGFSALPRRLSLAGLGAAAAALLVANGLGSALPRTQPQLSRTLVVAEHVRATVPEDGLLVAVGIDAELRLALPYLTSRRVMDLTSEVHAARRSGARPEAALERWLKTAAAAPEAWLLEDLDRPEIAAWVEELGVPPAAWERARRSLRPGPGALLEADGVVIREPVTLRRLLVVGPTPPG